jgi:N-succinyldiaminopimelate aminotransferase
MSPVIQTASIAAWADEAHVVANRAMYRDKFALITPLLAQVLDVRPARRRFLSVGRCVGGSDTEFARELFALYNVTVLPRQFSGP